jgi:hypothetical protein
MQAFPVARLRQPFVPIHGFVGQTAQSIQPSIPRFMGQEGQSSTPLTEAEQQKLATQYTQLLRTAAAKMIKSAQDEVQNLDTIYNNYVNFGRTSGYLAAITVAISMQAGNPYFTAGAVIYETWKRADAAAKATTIVQASVSHAQKWMNARQSDFFPLFIDDIEYMDPALAQQASAAFNKVSKGLQRNIDLKRDINKLPDVVLGNVEQIFFPAVYKAAKELPGDLANIATSLENIRRAITEGIKGAAKVIEAAAKIAEGAGKGMKSAPWLVLGGIGIIAVWLLLK